MAARNGVNPRGQAKTGLLKVVLIGDGGVGKSSLMSRYVVNRWVNWYLSYCYDVIGIHAHVFIIRSHMCLTWLKLLDLLAALLKSTVLHFSPSALYRFHSNTNPHWGSPQYRMGDDLDRPWTWEIAGSLNKKFQISTPFSYWFRLSPTKMGMGISMSKTNCVCKDGHDCEMAAGLNSKFWQTGGQGETSDWLCLVLSAWLSVTCIFWRITCTKFSQK